MITQLRPPQSRPVPGSQLRITWSGVAGGDTVGARITGSTVRWFDGSQPPVGFIRRGEAWLVDLNRVEDAETIDLELHVSTTGSRTVMVGDLNSDVAIEHVGLELTPRAEPYVFFRLTRRHDSWIIEAKPGDPNQVPLFVGGETIVVSIDRSASMIPWFRSGSVCRLLAGILEAAKAVDISAVRLAAIGDASELATDVETIPTHTDAVEYLDRLAQVKRFSTGSDYLEAARLSLVQAAGDRKVAVLITDSPPVRGCAALTNVAKGVVAVVGTSDLADTFDLVHWQAAGRAGLGIVPVGDVPSARAAVNMLSRAVNAS